MEIVPAPTDEEAAAIVAAVSLATTGAAAPAPERTTPVWRFSARHWIEPIPLRRRRP